MTSLEYSVAMCTYNGATYIAEQLNSILAQTVLPAEIIISDDSSTDDTLQIANNILAQSTVPYCIYTNNSRYGVVGNFWHAFSKCTNDIIFSCDQDDVWLPKKAEIILKVFATNQNALLVFSDAQITDENLHVTEPSLWSKVGFDCSTFGVENAVSTLLTGPKVTGATMAFKKTLFDGNENCPGHMLHDEYLAFKAAVYGGLYTCNEKTMYYRQHQNNVVGVKGKSIRRWFQNFRSVRVFREKEYLGWQLLSERFFTLLKPSERTDVAERVLFWKDIYEMENHKKSKRIRTMMFHWKNGNYKRYYCGIRGLIRDLMIELVTH